MYVIIELAIYLAWSAVVISRFRRSAKSSLEELLLIFLALPIAAFMEIRNELLQGTTGVYYPHSLYYFPRFNFPLAIMLSSSLFPFVLLLIARGVARRVIPVYGPN